MIPQWIREGNPGEISKKIHEGIYEGDPEGISIWKSTCMSGEIPTGNTKIII